MPNFETMKALRWKLDQAHTKTTPKTFLKSLRGGEVVAKESSHPAHPWTADIMLYILFMAVVIAFVWLVMKFANDYKPL
jgi:flagellar biogenesis protein FliO